MLKSIFDWLMINWSYILSGMFTLVLLASFVVHFTKDDKDNQFMRKLIQFLDFISLAKTDRDKNLLKYAKENLEANEKQ